MAVNSYPVGAVIVKSVVRFDAEIEKFCSADGRPTQLWKGESVPEIITPGVAVEQVKSNTTVDITPVTWNKLVFVRVVVQSLLPIEPVI